MLEGLGASADPNLLVGAAGADDAAVYRIDEQRALVHTADFFTPIVDDPFAFGRIAATNALSDVYAMGGTPLVALNLVAYPLDELPIELLREILAGGAAAVAAAGAVVGGGHSIDDSEPKYGMAVCGLVDPDRLLTNSSARPGDCLVLTKPLGAGLAATAAKRDIAPPGLIERATEVMCELNDAASQAAVAAGAHAATDVTGFGLLGHLQEMCIASRVGAELEAAAVPAIEGVLELAEEPGAIAGGSRRNAEQAAAFTSFDPGVSPDRRALLSDAMTSGGLLVAAPPAAAGALPGPVIGKITASDPGRIVVR